MTVTINGSGTITGVSTMGTTVVNQTLTTPTITSTMGVGNATPSSSGAGITFPATQSASTNANTLDDYEEGTWTGGFGGKTATGTWTAVSGVYIKIGSYVYIEGSITGTSMAFASAGTYAYINDLPFSCASTSIGTFGTGSISGTGLHGVVYCGGNQAILYGANTSASVNDIQFTAVFNVA